MLGRILPQEHGFFDLFKESADYAVAAMQEFRRMVEFPKELEGRARAIKEFEHRADEVTHKTMLLLHRTFITPLDREDIHALIKSLDDILDFIDASAQRLHLYDVREIPEGMVRMAEVTVESVELVRKAVRLLTNLKNTEDLQKICVEINRLENQADQVLRAEVAKLFRDEQDLRTLIKLKEIYELLETVSDRCEDVANVIESIVLEYA
nr:CorA-like Mg2+ transporter protein [uncultured bacterium]